MAGGRGICGGPSLYLGRINFGFSRSSFVAFLKPTKEEFSILKKKSTGSMEFAKGILYTSVAESLMLPLD